MEEESPCALAFTLAEGDVLVARLWRWDEDRIRKDAERSKTDRKESDPDDYSVSVFCLAKESDTTDEQLAATLCRKVRDAPRDAAWVTFTTQDRLEDAGFTVRLSEPPPAHHDVVLGTSLEDADVARLASVFSAHPRRKFKTCLT